VVVVGCPLVLTIGAYHGTFCCVTTALP